MKLTEHFTLEELTRSATAERLGIDNTLHDEVEQHQQVIENLRGLCQQVLEPLRQHFGVPICINSGYRSAPLNEAVGGVANSQHRWGQAADLRLPRDEEGLPDLIAAKQWICWMVTHTPIDICILEHDTHGNYWIHVSHVTHGKNRHRVIWVYQKMS